MIRELRVRDLVTIADVTLAARPGPQRPHRRDRGRQVHAGRRAGAAPGRAGRQWHGAARRRPRDCRGRVRAGAGADSAAGSRRRARRRRRPAGHSAGNQRGRTLARLGERQPHHRSACWPGLAACWSTSTASIETQSLLHADAQRDILDAFAGADSERGALLRRTPRWGRCGRKSRRSRPGGTRCAGGPTTCGTWPQEIDAAKLRAGRGRGARCSRPGAWVTPAPWPSRRAGWAR